MSVRAKMIVTELLTRTSAYRPAERSCVVKLAPVQDDGNKSWAKYTPSGSIELAIDNPAAYAAFVLGQTYFVDFTPAPATEAEEEG